MYFVTFESCNPTIGSHWLTHTMKIIVSLLLADTVCTHSHSLLLLVQLKKLVTTAHEQCAMTRGAGWEHNFCHFERGVCCVVETTSDTDSYIQFSSHHSCLQGGCLTLRITMHTFSDSSQPGYWLSSPAQPSTPCVVMLVISVVC